MNRLPDQFQEFQEFLEPQDYQEFLEPQEVQAPQKPREHHHRHRHRSHSPYVTKVASDGNDQERTDYIIETFIRNFGPQMKENPKAWRGRFRKMASNEFAFYRGSAVLFYRDMQHDLGRDRWLKVCPEASNIFIHGDLHAENFGTYIDRYGLINFDVNDFDEGYLGPFTWDVKRLVASINIIGFSKAYCDEKIGSVVRALVRAYLAQINEFCQAPDSPFTVITSENTTGPVNKLLKEARLGSREANLNTITVVENYERKFIRSSTMKDVDDQLRHEILLAFQEYLRTIPESKKQDRSAYQVKDIVSRASVGIGSAGRVSYNLLLQGKTQALESDVVIFMKPALPSAVASVLNNQEVEHYFRHDGLRTVLCAYAMHAVTSKWLGYATLQGRIPMLVDEVATHNHDLDWKDINGLAEITETAGYLGRAMAKIHCISDIDSINKVMHSRQHTDLLPLNIIPHNTERTIRRAIGGDEEGFIEDMVSFAMKYGNVVRRDHRLFAEAVRNERIPILNAFETKSDHVPRLPAASMRLRPTEMY